MRVELLGPLRVFDDDGTPRPVTGAKDRALLALLALNASRPVSVDRLTDGLWGEELPRNPANALQARVSSLRSVLGPVVEHTAAGYALNVAPHDVDVTAYQELLDRARAAASDGQLTVVGTDLDEALRLWRGRALDDVDAEFARVESVRLTDTQLTAQEDLAETRLALGEHHEVVPELSALVAAEPLRERRRALLMLALYRSGRQTEALETYQQGRQVLADELGLDPGPALRELEAAILRQDPALAPPSRSPKRRGNLPVPITSFVGRDDELAHVHVLLRDHRLVTLTGPGGTGKTRLALQAAAQIEAELAHPVWFVDLAAVLDPSDVPTAFTSTVAAAADAKLAPVDRTIAALADDPALVIVDNCEHLLAAAAEMVRAVLAGCRGTRVLATSREQLGTPGEAQYPVPPLPAEHAAALFLARAASAAPGHLSAADYGSVAEICQRLDGLPLAVELAAARTKALPVADIAGRLDRRLRLLVGKQAATGRQQTMRAAIDWSYDLLFADERQVFQQLAVCAGSWPLSAALDMCAAEDLDSDDVTDIVTQLVDKSLLISVPSPHGARFRMLETLREYALDKLDTTATSESTRLAHATWCLGLAEMAADGVRGPQQVEWLDRLDEDWENLTAALHWAVQNQPRIALRLVGALLWPRFLRGRHHLAQAEINRVLDVAESATDPEAYARALAWSGFLSDASGWPDPAIDLRAMFEHATDVQRSALALARQSGPPRLVIDIERLLATTLIRRTIVEPGHTVEARELLADARRLAAETDDDWGRAVTAMVAMYAPLVEGDYEACRAAITEAEPTLLASGDLFLLERLMFIQATIAEREGDVAVACALHERALAAVRELGNNEFAALHLAQLAHLRPDAVDEAKAVAASIDAADLARLAANRLYLGDASLALGNFLSAEAMYRGALDWYRQLDMTDGQERAERGLAAVRDARGEP